MNHSRAPVCAVGPCGRGLLTAGLALLGVLSADGARADVPVWVDCYLPTAEEELELECRELRQAFAASIPGVSLEEGAPRIHVVLRSQEEAIGSVFYAEFSGIPAGSGADNEIRFSLAHRIARAAGKERTLLVLIALLQRGLAPFLLVDSPGETTGGQLTLGFRTEEQTHVSEVASGWYVRPAFTGDVLQVGLQKFSLTGDLEANYSLPLWRFRLVSQLIWEHWDFQIPDGRLEGSFLRGDARLHIVRSLGKGFSAAVVGAVGGEPQNNIGVRTEGGYGIEWALAPFVRAGQANVGLRMTGLVIHDQYVTPNIEDRDARTTFRPSLTAFARIHFDRVDIDSSFWAAIIADRPEIWGWGGNSSIAFRIAEGLQFTVTGWFTHQPVGVLREPRDSSFLDDVTAAALGNDFGNFVLGANASLSYAFGNALLRSQDQRWR